VQKNNEEADRLHVGRIPALLRDASNDCRRTDWSCNECMDCIYSSVRAGTTALRHRFQLSDVIANESLPIQLAQCWFPALAISNAKNIIIYLSSKLYESNFIKFKQHPETVMVWNYQTANCSFTKKEFIVSFVIIFSGTLSFPISTRRRGEMSRPQSV